MLRRDRLHFGPAAHAGDNLHIFFQTKQGFYALLEDRVIVSHHDANSTRDVHLSSRSLLLKAAMVHDIHIPLVPASGRDLP